MRAQHLEMNLGARSESCTHVIILITAQNIACAPIYFACAQVDSLPHNVKHME